MSTKIQVTCASCFKRFEVSEQFAGKEGPCPACGKVIRIPTLDEQVNVREVAGFGGVKDASGKLVLKPIERADAKFSPVAAGIIGVALVGLFIVAFMIKGMDAADKTPLLIIGSIVIAIPLAWAGYWFLRDDELEPYGGLELWIRVGICSVCYAAIWGVYAFFIGYLELNPEDLPFLVTMVIISVAAGSFIAAGCFDIEPISGFLHYTLYLAVTILLRMTMDLPGHFTYWWQ
ncbi:MAG: hypothetical protein COA78_25860 [Blastopirellula sp.]|nr:MAG: hypothetical protein COA78_25860 [Blastopirellula sp.]